jgi:hypothetical protein
MELSAAVHGRARRSSWPRAALILVARGAQSWPRFFLEGCFFARRWLRNAMGVAPTLRVKEAKGGSQGDTQPTIHQSWLL